MALVLRNIYNFYREHLIVDDGNFENFFTEDFRDDNVKKFCEGNLEKFN